MTNVLECKSLTKAYGPIHALYNVDLSVGQGRIVGLRGPNGSGKTTLIKMANGLLTPSGGEILINGLDPGVDSKKAVSYLHDTPDLMVWT